MFMYWRKTKAAPQSRPPRRILALTIRLSIPIYLLLEIGSKMAAFGSTAPELASSGESQRSGIIEARAARKLACARAIQLERELIFLSDVVDAPDALRVIGDARCDLTRLEERLAPHWLDVQGVVHMSGPRNRPQLAGVFPSLRSTLACHDAGNDACRVAVEKCHGIQDALTNLSRLVDQPESKEEVTALREVASALSTRLETLARMGQ